MTHVKICGITSLEDACAAAAAGATAIGFVFAPSSRRITATQAREVIAGLRGRIITVGVFQDAPLDEVRRTADELAIDCIQLHGDESPEYCTSLNRPILKRLPVRDNDTPSIIRDRMGKYQVAAFLLDPGAGDGRAFNWSQARDLGARIVIAGGLNPENVATPVQLLQPFAVDVSTGVESAPGRKDPAKLNAFVQAVRNVNAC